MVNRLRSRSRKTLHQLCSFSIHCVVILVCGYTLSAQSPQKSFANRADPMAGTAADGQTYPSVGYPFAMTQWTAETRVGEEKCIAPYYAKDTRIFGFRGSHFLSGSCVQDYGSFSILPGSGKIPDGPAGISSRFEHAEERSSPYAYSVNLPELHVGVEMSGTLRSGIFRLTFKNPGEAWLLVRSNARNGKGQVEFDPQHNEVTGKSPVTRIYAGSGRPAGFSGYFVIASDHSFEVVKDKSNSPAQTRILFRNVTPGVPVIVKIGSSFVSVEEARHNLESEIPNWDFDAVSKQSKQVWEDALGRIEIRGDSPDRRTFYTALYHSMVAPRTYSDVSGTYPEFAGNQKTERADGYVYYSDYSVWDTFRALHPLLTIIDIDHDRDMVRSLVEMGKQGGYLPIYPAWNSYTSEMDGDHEVAIIGDAYLKGIGGFDPAEAYELIRKNATEVPSIEMYRDGRGRRALESYLKYGFIPLEDPVQDAFHVKEQVSRTLDYAYDDFVVSEVARKLGKTEDAEIFRKRADNYKNVIDPKTGFARGRHADGKWAFPFDPAKETTYVTEGTPFQYTFFVLQDIPGLIQWVGGRKAFLSKLDELFEKKYYDHGNEPSHHIAYLYNYAGEAWKTQERVPEILKTYKDRVDGLPGNDDAGQMSAWYVLSALGLYQVTPGIPQFEVTSPHFDNIVLHLPNGHTLQITAPGATKGAHFIQSVTFNGRPLPVTSIPYSELMGGGELKYQLSTTPNKYWPGTSEKTP